MSPYNRLREKGTALHLIAVVKRFVIVTGSCFLLFLLLNWSFPLHDAIDFSTVIKDSRGELVNAYLTKDDKWRMKTELSEISPLLRQTIIAKEDKYFYRHPGINIIAVGRAAFNNLFHLKRTSGASTITMQVARALEQHRSRTLGNKLLECFRALQLEWKYSKEEILQLYLNLVPYGGNIEGVKAAALLYFKKNPNHLSLAEITALSIIPNRPSSLVLGRHNDAVKQQRNEWLQRFSKEGLFTSKEIEDALAEPLSVQRDAVPHFIPHLSYKLKEGATTASITTTIQLNTQLKIEKLTEDYVRVLKFKNINNAAVIVVDNQSHQVIAYIGSAGFRDTADGGQVNGAAAIRQPGSTLKPLLYGLCMDEGLLTPKTIINDVPVNYSGYAPENYDQQFNGYVTVEAALEHSLNIPAVKSLQRLGTDALINKLAAADFSQVSKDRSKLGLSLILGGCGASLEQLTGLFSAFSNDGIYSPLQFTKDSGAPRKTRLLSPEANYLITDILSKVARPDFPLNWSATERMPKIAWKTGTSYGRKDAWSIGYNKRYTVGVWAGNFSGAGSPDLSGANTATPLLFKIFNTIDYANDGDWFAPPKGLEQRQVCPETGLLPGPFCTTTTLDYFIPLISSTQTCRHLQEIKVSPDSTIAFCEACAPATGYIKKLYRVLPPEMEDYFSANTMAYAKVPPHNPACEKLFRGDGPSITSPLNGTEYYINQNDPEPLQLAAHTSTDVSRVWWYINDQFYKAAAPGDKVFFVPEEGPVKISCTDDKGRNRNIQIRVRKVRL
ncbi:MAG: glycosyl transferase [Flaviaesturariibacter sp.]|nr:glycosyl transferase [Flaviaesturariibacter sp.]